MCGHAAIAMLAASSLERVATMLGHRGPTTWREVYSALFTLGVVCDPELRACFTPTALPPVAVVQVPSGSPAIHHWVVVAGGVVYDPARAATYAAVELPFAIKPATAVLRVAAVRNGPGS